MPPESRAHYVVGGWCVRDPNERGNKNLRQPVDFRAINLS